MIDLHAHSTASDGTESPADLVASAAAAGLGVVAITDHDTTLGWAEATEAARRAGVALVPGIEVSCGRRGRSLHLLAYLPDPSHPDLVAELEQARDSRDSRLDRMVGRMAAAGIPVTVEAVRAEVDEGATPGRPHIADALVRAGVVTHRDEAFARWLSDDSPFYVSHYAPDPVRAVEVVRAAGGVPVVAHPSSRTRTGTVGDALIEELAAAGLAGLEVHHRDHEPHDVTHLTDLAARLGLFVTGSSDYHGEGKRNRLGENTTDPDVLERIEASATGAEVVRA
ncbi:PHP domain-containing protein [Phycicoccus sonneratiae]|uniref:PHP domain-containing protein n=1 Tax=Phycicoccus sonneratiae TaxID=2807628 RepID=A0ABS2CLN3_9MICO|nr:PHP domain-containing protein [Phycicoccus sonneraticus]MBM6400786.1 PHP domain-containing protein [Phycicoccus sonneraticus]